jgi:hypothetical protein
MKKADRHLMYTAHVIVYDASGSTPTGQMDIAYKMGRIPLALEYFNERVIEWAEKQRDERGMNMVLLLPAQDNPAHWACGMTRVEVMAEEVDDIPF